MIFSYNFHFFRLNENYKEIRLESANKQKGRIKMQLKLLKNNYLFQAGIETIEKVNLQDEIKTIQVGNGYILQRKITNTTQQVVKVKELSVKIYGIELGEKQAKDYFYCVENARLYGHCTLPIDLDRVNETNINEFGIVLNKRFADPGTICDRILSSPYQPFPALLIGNYENEKGVVFGTLNQDVFYHNYTLFHDENKLNCVVYSSFKDIAYRELQPNETLKDEWYIGICEDTKDINHIFDGYTKQLRQVLKNYCGKSETNRHTLIWDSWNDGIFRDVSEEMLLKEAKAVKKYFPTVEWFQLDDGYSAYCEKNVDLDSHGIGVPYEENGVDRKKFPGGLKAYTDKIKEIGLKPAIWIGGLCPVKTKIYQENPEWFIDYTYRIDWAQPLDVSQEQVRGYMCYALDKLILEYGFEGVKHDFWSYAFEDRHDLLKNKYKSGYEQREWWHKELRKRLPDYGYLETGCDIGMGNPFIGKYFNNYRFGLDIGAGNWNNIQTSMFWSVAVLSSHAGDLFIPNSDSIGLLPNLNDEDFMFVVNWQIITRTLVEISGRFSLVEKNNPRLQVLKRATAYLNNGEDVYFAKYDYRQKGLNLPEIIYINSAFDCMDDRYKTIAVFNSEEKEKIICFTPLDIGLTEGEYEVEYVWENKRERLNSFKFTLNPHQSILLKIRK